MNSHPFISPPKWANRFLEWYCHEELLDEIQGDLIEQFHKNHHKKSPKLARWKFVVDVFRFFRPSSFKNTQFNMNTHILTNYLKVAFRVFKKEKGYTFSNIFGLALGISCSLLIYLWVQDELKYNQWPSDLDKIHMVLVKQQETSGKIHTWATTPQPLQPVMQEKYPAIEKAGMVNWGTSFVMKKGDDIMELNGNYGTPEIFEVFSMNFIQGTHKTMYEQAESIAISATSAEKYFGADWRSTNLIGTDLTDKNNRTFKLVGIFEDLPKHSTLKFEFIIPFEYMLTKQPWNKHWGNYNHHMYVKLAEGYNTESAQVNVVNAIADNRPDNQDVAPLILQPFGERYLYAKYENGVVAGGRIDYVKLLSISALLILVLAAVNFMNLTTARSAKRSKETGIRKVMGAKRGSLQSQFIIEAILITFIAFVIAGVAVFLLLPFFNHLSGKQIGWEFLTPQFVLQCFGFILALGFLSGVYPAFYMSALNPILSIKGILKTDRSNALFRKGLVVFQFAITIIMIIGSVTIYKQLQYVLNKNLGLDRENVIKMSIGDMSKTQFKSYRGRLLDMQGIQSVALANSDPTDIGNSTSDPHWDGKDENAEIYFNVLGADEYFIPMMDIQVVSGRNFDPEIASDSTNYIINEVTARIMGFEDPIGQKLEFWGNPGRIIGVVKNFHIASLHSPINPMILRLDPDPWLVMIKTKPGETTEAIHSLETLHKEYNPNSRFDFSFMEDDYLARYKSEQLVSKLTLVFTIVSIVISCLGLLSLISFSTELKTKEIGIRKVLGASVSSILTLISREFVTLIVVSFVVAAPVASYIMSGWLDKFAYKINLDLWLYVIAGASALLITLVTIASHALRTATRNPVESLRTE